MATQVQFRRGTNSQNNNFTGAVGEISINTDTDSIRVHDGSTQGGFELARNNLSNTKNVGVLTATVFKGNVNSSGVSTFANGKVVVGGATTELVVNGNARITGILTIGTGSITINPTNDSITLGSGLTITSSGSGNFSGNVHVGGSLKVIGVATASSFSGPLSGNASSATQLQTARNISLTGDVAGSVSFNGTSNVSIAATIQPNSVALGSDTTGNYVQSISGTSNQITVTGGSGESSTPTLSVPNQFTAPQDVTVTRDLQVNRNLNVNGNITIGGTAAYINATELRVKDPDIILGFRTDASNKDISNDNTANHGGIAIASTEGTPLVNLFIAGIETAPSTYKKIMWFKAGTFSGLGTDAWLTNYAVGIGSTQFPLGTRLAAGSVQFGERDLKVVRHINASGIVTSTGGFSGNLTGTATSTTNIPNLTGDVTSINKTTTLATVNNNVGTFGSGGAIPSITVNAKGLITGVTTSAITPANNGTLTLATSGTGLSGSASFSANQSGNATFTVSSNATSNNTNSTIVARDASGNFSAGTITASLSGTATSTTNIPNLTGDVTSVNKTTTLATVNSNVGTFGSSGAIPSITVNAKGLITGISTSAISSGITITNDTTTNASRYVTFTSATSGSISAQNVSSTKLIFNPSTGTLESTNFNSTSDVNLKENIKTINNPMDVINQIRGVEFTWKDSNQDSLGVIAQEVESVLPQLVTENDYKSVNYNGLIGVLIEAVKEQQKQIQSLTEKIRNLEEG